MQWVIIVAAIAWYVIQAVVAAAQKRQEQERLRQAAEQRKQSAGTTGAGSARTTGSAGGTGRPTPVTAPATATERPSRAVARSREEAAARRQQQLAELRQRRADRAATPNVQARVKQPLPFKPKTAGSPGDTGRSTGGTTTKELSVDEFRHRLEVQARQTQSQDRHRISRSHAEPRKRTRPTRSSNGAGSAITRGSVVRTAPQVPVVGAVPAAIRPGKKIVYGSVDEVAPARRLRRRLASRQALQDAIVLSEVLGQPAGIHTWDERAPG